MNIRVVVTNEEIALAQSEKGWTETRTRVAFALFAAGKSDAQIACLIGGVTRNAVIGRRNRAGVYVGAGDAAVDRPQVSKRRPQHSGQPNSRLAVPRPHLYPKPKPARETKSAPPPIVDAAIPVPQRRSLLDLTDACCHWPVGHPGQPDFFFCGAVVVREDGERHRPYCPSHMRRAHDYVRARRRSPDDLVPEAFQVAGQP